MKKIIIMISSFCLSLPITGQNIAAFSGTKTPRAVTVPNMTAKPLSRGPGLTVAGGPTFNSGNWATGEKLDTNDYIEWSVTAAPGYIITIKELQINFDRDPDGLSHFFTGNGPAKIRLRTSLDNFTSNIYSNDKVSNSGLSPTIETTLKSTPGGTIIFRIYGFSSSIGMLGPLGTFDIEGGLGKILGLDNTGIRLAGTVTYDGLLYSDNKWIPRPPSTSTGDKNVFIVNGTYEESDKVQVKNLTVHSGAGIIIRKSGAITVNGNLNTADNVILQSDTDTFSSLIVKDSVIGTAQYHRQVNITTPIGGLGNNNLVSAPVTGEAFNVFRSSNPNIATNKVKTLSLFGPFNKVKSAFTTYSNTETTVLTPGTGYRASTSKNGKLTFTGIVNTKAIHKTIINSRTVNPEWNLIGNPYPSHLSLRDFLAANNSEFSPETSGLYSYSGDPSNGWTIWNLAYLTVHPHAKIAPGQGFFVAAKTGGGNVTFIPEMQSVGDINEFNISKEQIAKNIGFLRLNLSNGISNYSTDFYFNDQSSKGLDPGYDAAIYGGQAPDFAIYSHLVDDNTGLDMAIQSLPYIDLSNKITIALGINATAGQQITLSITDAILPEETEVYLEDVMTNTFTLLNTNNYTFCSNSQISKTGRFFLHFRNSTLTFGNTLLPNLQLFTTNGSNTLHIKGTIEPNTVISVYDLQGRLMFSTQLEEGSKNNQMDMSTLSGGMYLIKLKTGSLEKTRKTIILDKNFYKKRITL